jgi:hypothetical protein
LLAIAAVVAAQAQTFAPPLDRPLTYRIEQQRPDDDFRFALTRRVTFRREAGAIVAEVVFAGTEASGGPATYFARGAQAFRGRPLRFTLSPGGRIVALDDLDGAWATFLAGVATMARPGSDPAAALRALPVERRLGVLGSQLAQILAGDLAAIEPGSTPVTLPATLLAGRPVALTGTRTASRGGDGRITIHTQASGTADETGMTLDRTQVIDPATGLVLSSREVTQTTLTGTTKTVIATVVLG